MVEREERYGERSSAVFTGQVLRSGGCLTQPKRLVIRP
jgi:hypothetical protein